MSVLEQLFHDAFVAFATRHREELDRWAAHQQLKLATVSEFHRRGMGQVVRQARIRLLARSEFFPEVGDPDFLAIVQAKRNLDMSHALDTMRTVRVRRHEERVRAVLDTPYNFEWSLP